MAAETTRQFAVVIGASSGIGYELAKQFAQNSFDLLLVSAGERINSAAADISGLASVVDVKVLQADLATHEGVHALISAMKAHDRPIDAIALNAGVGVSGPFAETDLKEELNMVALNVTCTVHLAKYVVKDMVARGSGRILSTASISGTMPTPFETVSEPLKLSSAPFLRVFAKN
jgi:uncharacterized protein